MSKMITSKIRSCSYLGIPFLLGGRDPHTGLDCFGLVRQVLLDHGRPCPDVPAGYPADWAQHQDLVGDHLTQFGNLWQPIPIPEPLAVVAMSCTTHHSPLTTHQIIDHLGIIPPDAPLPPTHFLTTWQHTGTVHIPLRPWQHKIKSYYRFLPS